MRTLSGDGVTVTLPDGWEGRSVRTDGGGGAAAARAAGPADSPQVLQLASFAIPTEVGDFGGGAVELMSNRDLLIVLLEFGRESATQPLFAAKGIPRLTSADVSASQLQRQLEGQGGV